MGVLGSLFDQDLTFDPLVTRVIGSTTSEVGALTTHMRDLSVGLEQQASQLPIRVYASTLCGSEPLASAAIGCHALPSHENHA